MHCFKLSLITSSLLIILSMCLSLGLPVPSESSVIVLKNRVLYVKQLEAISGKEEELALIVVS